MQVVLIGHSMGGYTNMELMESFPEKIALAMFVSTTGTPSGVAYTDSPLFDLVRSKPSVTPSKYSSKKPCVHTV